MHTMQYSTAIRWVNQMCMYWPGKMSMALNEKKKWDTEQHVDHDTIFIFLKNYIMWYWLF